MDCKKMLVNMKSWKREDACIERANLVVLDVPYALQAFCEGADKNSRHFTCFDG